MPPLKFTISATTDINEPPLFYRPSGDEDMAEGSIGSKDERIAAIRQAQQEVFPSAPPIYREPPPGAVAERLARLRERAALERAESAREEAGAVGTAIIQTEGKDTSMFWEPDYMDEFDMAEAADVARVKAVRDPALWHEAAMAALAYRGDPHGFLPWLVKQPELDRATAGWIFLWAEGSRYLRGDRRFPFDHCADDAMVTLFAALCARSELSGFGGDHIGLDRDFEAEREACLGVIASGGVAAGIIVPHAIIDTPFAPPRDDSRYTLDDGIILVA